MAYTLALEFLLVLPDTCVRRNGWALVGKERMLKRTVGLVLAGSVLVGIGAVSQAQADTRRPHAYDAIVLCNPGIAEDSAGHVRLVQYEHAPEGLVIVYRCKKNGY
jgi:hypothetical protein